MQATECRTRSSSGTGESRSESQKPPEARIGPADNGRSAGERGGRLSLHCCHRGALADRQKPTQS